MGKILEKDRLGTVVVTESFENARKKYNFFVGRGIMSRGGGNFRKIRKLGVVLNGWGGGEVGEVKKSKKKTVENCMNLKKIRTI